MLIQVLWVRNVISSFAAKHTCEWTYENFAENVAKCDFSCGGAASGVGTRWWKSVKIINFSAASTEKENERELIVVCVYLTFLGEFIHLKRRCNELQVSLIQTNPFLRFLFLLFIVAFSSDLLVCARKKINRWICVWKVRRWKKSFCMINMQM